MRAKGGSNLGGGVGVPPLEKKWLAFLPDEIRNIDILLMASNSFSRVNHQTEIENVIKNENFLGMFPRFLLPKFTCLCCQ